MNYIVMYLNFMKEKEQEIKNQIILEKDFEKIIGKLKPIKYLKNEFLRIKKEYNQEIKKLSKKVTISGKISKIDNKFAPDG